MSLTPARSPELMSRQDTRLLIVDMQQRLLPVIPDRERLLANVALLARVAHLLGMPVSATQQYPQGLGPTDESLLEWICESADKVRFSAAGALPWMEEVSAERPKVLIAGIETHVCVQQTVFDLLARGFSVYVAADATASRHDIDATHALTRMRDSGATVTTTEAALFEWSESADIDQFKQLSALVKERSAREASGKPAP